MKIRVTDLQGRAYKASQPYPGALYVKTEMKCPHCGEENMNVAGMEKHIDPEARHDTYKAKAIHYATECGKTVGTIRCKVNSFFGLEEDEAVFRMGIKIY